MPSRSQSPSSGSGSDSGSDSGQETTHRGVRWRRDRAGNVSFYDDQGRRWVAWEPGGDSPPLPPRWSILGVPTRVERPGWRSRWRIIPVVLVLAAVAIGVLQALFPPSGDTAKEAKAAAALLGKCLAQNGTAEGHPRYSATPVPCSSPKATVRVVQVVPSTPGSPLCPVGSTGVELPYPGVAHPHIECLVPIR